jgi:hypothetical protein
VQDAGLTHEQLKILKIFERTFKCYIIEDPAAKVRGLHDMKMETLKYWILWLTQ